MRKSSKDLAGQKFNKLTVLYKIEKSEGRTCYMCKCDCGNEKIFIGVRIKNGDNKSCGCLAKTNILGQTFNRLTAIEEVEPINGNTAYLFKCTCGNEKVMRSSAVLTGRSKSCGCLSIEMINAYNKKVNKFDLTGDFGIGYTTKGEEFYFDLEDYEKIKDYCWYLNGSGYATAKINNKKMFMHKFVTEGINTDLIDHKDRNKLNNTKDNLRICSVSDNNINISLRKDNSTGVTGVHFIERSKAWISQIQYKDIKYSQRHCTYENAVRCRLMWEIEILGYAIAPQKHLFEQYGIKQNIKQTEELINE